MRKLVTVCREYLTVALVDGIARAELHREMAKILAGKKANDYRVVWDIHEKTQEITGSLRKSIDYPKEIIDLILYGRISDDLLKGAAKKYAPILRDALKKEIRDI